MTRDGVPRESVIPSLLEMSPCFTMVLGLDAARAEIHEMSPYFTRVLGFYGGEGLNSRDVPVFYECFWI